MTIRTANVVARSLAERRISHTIEITDNVATVVVLGSDVALAYHASPALRRCPIVVGRGTEHVAFTGGRS